MIKLIFRKIIQKYSLAFLVIWIGGMLLKSPDTHWLQVTFGLFFMHAWVYFVHRGVHLIPKWGPLEWFNTHMFFHHQEEKPLHRSLELLFEFFTDTGMNTLIIPVQMLLGITLVPLPCVILFTLAYTSIHIVNYSMFGSVFHKRHHLTMVKNFAPDAMDHLVGSNYNDEFEDLVPFSLNVVICTAILYLIKDLM